MARKTAMGSGAPAIFGRLRFASVDVAIHSVAELRILDGDPRLDLITARHVLSHSSGLQNWRSEREPLKIHFTPGEQYLYSGS